MQDRTTETRAEKIERLAIELKAKADASVARNLAEFGEFDCRLMGMATSPRPLAHYIQQVARDLDYQDRTKAIVDRARKNPFRRYRKSDAYALGAGR